MDFKRHGVKRIKAKCANLTLYCLMFSDDVSLDQIKLRTEVEFRSSKNILVIDDERL